MKVALLTLGCDKNTVDSERYLALLLDHGAEETRELREAELIIVNTCGFIDAAKRESIDAIVRAGRLKIDGSAQAVVAVGCMIERHGVELAAMLPEVDFFLGASEMEQLLPRLQQKGLLGDTVTMHPGIRAYGGDTPHVRYLKVSEGCDHGCAFCAIPLMRGKHRSRPVEELVREAQELESQGAREINLVAQDLGHYGRDVPGSGRLSDLIGTLLKETGVSWYRPLYVYSMGITKELVELWATEPRLVPYIDMPIQHGNDRMLKLMRRPERKDTIRTKVAWLRDAVPGMAIRTTTLVGFPTETETEFTELLEFVDEMQFDRLGVFGYSPQDGTRAAELADDVPDDVKRDRVERVTELQRAVSADRLERFVGTDVDVLVDEGAGEDDPGQLIGRTAFQADDVDGCTYLKTGAPVGPGEFVRARVVDTLDYDLVAELAR